ncbi:MAG TPA: hypothetical protein VNQ76_11945 [Planctomicrobium sp.]|nr:hypothetical protein [Planctomicrobium sp.]
MFCTACGEKAKGKYCWKCGNAIEDSESSVHPIPLPLENWIQEHRYDVLIGIPEVRHRISTASAESVKTLTGEEFLQIAEKAMSPLTGGVPLSKVAAFAQPMYAKWGISTGKTRSETLPSPIGAVIVAVLCSLGRSGQEVKTIQQGTDGCVITAALPSDLHSFAGLLTISIEKKEHGTHVEAATRIQGQLFDWGKSRRSLERLFNDIHQAS